MGTPEDVATEEYFTPPSRRTLTEMLTNSDTFFHQDQITAAKDVFKEWLKAVGLPATGESGSARRLLITLVDEP